eukprot:5127437-Pyramimonas_sp.AAC.1
MRHPCPIIPGLRDHEALAALCPSHLHDSSCAGDATLDDKEKERGDAAEGAEAAEAAEDRGPEAAGAIEGADEAQA